MTRSEIIKMAREAGAERSCINDEVWMLALAETGFERFAEIVAARTLAKTNYSKVQSVLQAIKYDYANSLAHLDDLLTLSQITRMEWQTRREPITLRIGMIDEVLGAGGEAK